MPELDYFGPGREEPWNVSDAHAAPMWMVRLGILVIASIGAVMILMMIAFLFTD